MFQRVKHLPTGPIVTLWSELRGGAHVMCAGDTQSQHVGHVAQCSECLALPKHFMELYIKC